MITLIVVNCQNDFITGTMCFKGTRNVVEEIKNYIKKHRSEIDKIIFAVDWHPFNHFSFKKYGGLVKEHCVQYTPGACIEPKLLKLVQSYNIDYEVSTKGEMAEADQLGAFEEIEVVSDSLGERYYFDSLVTADTQTEFVVCGIGGDQCVKATIENLLKEDIVPKVYCPGIASIDGGRVFSNFIKEMGLEKTV